MARSTFGPRAHVRPALAGRFYLPRPTGTELAKTAASNDLRWRRRRKRSTPHEFEWADGSGGVLDDTLPEHFGAHGSARHAIGQYPGVESASETLGKQVGALLCTKHLIGPTFLHYHLAIAQRGGKPRESSSPRVCGNWRTCFRLVRTQRTRGSRARAESA